jgi:hypothetical protein
MNFAEAMHEVFSSPLVDTAAAGLAIVGLWVGGKNLVKRMAVNHAAKKANEAKVEKILDRARTIQPRSFPPSPPVR